MQNRPRHHKHRVPPISHKNTERGRTFPPAKESCKREKDGHACYAKESTKERTGKIKSSGHWQRSTTRFPEGRLLPMSNIYPTPDIHT